MGGWEPPPDDWDRRIPLEGIWRWKEKSLVRVGWVEGPVDVLVEMPGWREDAEFGPQGRDLGNLSIDDN